MHRIADQIDLGILPLRHEDYKEKGYDTQTRIGIMCASIRSLDDDEDGRERKNVGGDSDKDSLGDLLGGNEWQNEKTRKTAGWSFAWPTTTIQDPSANAPIPAPPSGELPERPSRGARKGGGRVGRRGGRTVGRRKPTPAARVRCNGINFFSLPINDAKYKPDARFKTKSPNVAPGLPHPKTGDVGITLTAIEEGGAQQDLFIYGGHQDIVADHRNVARWSRQVTDSDPVGKNKHAHADQRRRGGIQFPFFVNMSPSHRREGVGGTDCDRGWTPTLNFKDFAEANPPEAFELAGRGLFTEQQHGQHLGRLANLPLQSGPIMADAAT